MRPVVVTAMQWDGSLESAQRVGQWVNAHDEPDAGGVWDDPTLTFEWVSGVVRQMWVETLEGPLRVSPGDWLIRGVAGEFYPCKPDIFDATYETSQGRVTDGEIVC